jgi:hypothetical protein
MSKSFSSGLTGLEPSQSLAYLERDRWPEFEKELRARRPRVIHFDIHHYGEGNQPWEWLIWRCRNWSEIERVLNRHRVDWNREDGVIVMEGMRILRCC